VRPIAFSKTDCQLFGRYPKSVNFKEVSESDKQHYIDLRARLKDLAKDAAEQWPGRVAMKEHASIYSPNGRNAMDLWCCVFPKTAPNKSYSLQVATIISQRGAELCFCLGAGTAQVRDPDEIKKNKEALAFVRSGLVAVPPETIERVQEILRGSWQFRKQWRQQAGSQDFESLSDWIKYAASSTGDGASISMNLSPDELDALGTNFSDAFQGCVRTFAPIIESVYGDNMQTRDESSTMVAPALHDNETDHDISSGVRAVIDFIEAEGFIFQPWQIAAYITALRTKPFVILAGISGTGKSKLPALVAKATAGVSKILPVRPDWTDSSEVLGFMNLQGSFRPGELLICISEFEIKSEE
jgi:hypothetical protein